MRATGLIDLVGDRTRGLIASSFPAAPRTTGPDADPDVIPAREPGDVVRVDRAGLDPVIVAGPWVAAGVAVAGGRALVRSLVH